MVIFNDFWSPVEEVVIIIIAIIMLLMSILVFNYSMTLGNLLHVLGRSSYLYDMTRLKEKSFRVFPPTLIVFYYLLPKCVFFFSCLPLFILVESPLWIFIPYSFSYCLSPFLQTQGYTNQICNKVISKDST